MDLNDVASATPSSPVTVGGVNVDLHETPQEDVTALHDVRGINVRRVRWATGTNYVWIDSTTTDQLHVIDLGDSSNGVSSTVLLRTIDDIDSMEMIFVQNLAQNAIRSDIDSVKQRLQDDQNKTETIGIAGLVIATFAFVLTLANTYMLTTKFGSASSQGHSQTKHDIA